MTEKEELLLLVIMFICEAGTVVQSALGGRSLELLAEKILKPGITMSPFVARALRCNWLGMGVLVLSVLAGKELETGEDRDRFRDGTRNMD